MFPSLKKNTVMACAGAAAFLLAAGCGGGSDPAAATMETPHEHDSPPPETAAALSFAPPPGALAAAMPALSPDPTLAVSETIALAPIYTPLITGTINALPYWPVWYGNGKPVDGVNCLVSGKYHLHSLISIYANGKRLGFPDGIGRVHAGCYHAYELHVHDVTGIIHMETDVPKQFKLGQWFSLWGQALTRDNVAGLIGPVRYYIIEKEMITRYDGDPREIQMLPHREVLIVTGTAMSVAPKYRWPLGI